MALTVLEGTPDSPRNFAAELKSSVLRYCLVVFQPMIAARLNTYNLECRHIIRGECFAPRGRRRRLQSGRGGG